MSNPRKIRDYDLEKIKTVPKIPIFRLIFSRICISALLIILQVVVLAAVTFSWSERHTKRSDSALYGSGQRRNFYRHPQQ